MDGLEEERDAFGGTEEQVFRLVITDHPVVKSRLEYLNTKGVYHLSIFLLE